MLNQRPNHNSTALYEPLIADLAVQLSTRSDLRSLALSDSVTLSLSLLLAQKSDKRAQHTYGTPSTPTRVQPAAGSSSSSPYRSKYFAKRALTSL